MLNLLVSRYKSFSFLWNLLSKKTKYSVIFCLGLVFIQGIYQLISVYFLLPLISYITGSKNELTIGFFSSINFTPLQAFLLFLFSISSSFLFNYFVTRKTSLLISKFGYELGSTTFKRLISKKYTYFKNSDPSSLNNAIAIELELLIKGLFNPLLIIISSIIISLILVAALFFYSPYLIIALAFSFLLSLPIYKWNQRLATKKKIFNLKKNNKKLFEILNILINSPEEFYFSDMKLYLKQIFDKNYLELRSNQADIEYARFFTKFIVDLSLSFVLVILFFAAIYAQNISLDLTRIGFCLLIMQKLLPYLYQIYVNYLIIKASSPAYETISSINSRNSLDESYHQNNFSSLKYVNIESRYILATKNNPLNINLIKGDRLLLKGPSGSGKSTLLLIMSGLLKPEKGRLVLENNEKKIGRNLTSFIPQKSFCFSGSIAFNISLKNNLTKKQTQNLKEVYELSGLNQDFSFNEIFEKNIAENLSNISGGQLQRIAIARGIFSKPKYLFLDEPTSSLPKEISIKIINNISNYLTNSIIIYTSHKEYEWEISTKQIDLS
tara:strand:+ start:1613 stop:3271 length:1659 start_codon:yes stop_codon:yes gene_type:complete